MDHIIKRRQNMTDFSEAEVDALVEADDTLNSVETRGRATNDCSAATKRLQETKKQRTYGICR